MDHLKPVYDFVYKVVQVICKLMLIVEIILATIMVVGRFVFKNQPAWCTELILTFMVYMALLSATLALRRGAHIRMNAFDKYLPEGLLILLDLLADAAIFVFAVILIKDGWSYCSTAKGFFTSLPTVSKFWLYFAVPLSGVFTVVFQLEAVYNHIKKIFVKGGAAE
jgi:TRAP-type C4-dicarboxylate transport system permease small subunit